jgi:glycosyl-4,4'-diaponeurosporenoate acyltransferase
VTILLVNIFGLLIVQLSIAAVAVRIRPGCFAVDNRLYRVHTFEIEFYKRWLHVRRWRRRLPDGGPWVGGTFRKEIVHGSNSADLHQLLIETRRGEVAHWLMLASFPLFFPWNPPWARVLALSYALAANLPCIIVQRYNREAVCRIQLRRNTRA